MLLSPPAAAAAAAGPSLRRNYGLMDTALRIALHSTFSSSRFFSPAHQTPPTDFSILRRAGSWALHSAAQAHDVLHHAKPQRKTAPSLAPSSLQQIAASSHCSKAAPFLRYHMGSAMATEQYLARRRGDLYTVRASTQASVEGAGGSF